MKRISIIWLCYYIIARFESPGSKVSPAKQADDDLKRGKEIRRASLTYKKLTK